MSSYNKRSSKKLGWTPQWFNAEVFGEPLQLAVKEFQTGYPDLKVDGLCGPSTFRRIKLERELTNARPSVGDQILIGGKLHSIPWGNVIVPGEDGSLGLPKGFRKRKERYINMAITHWDVCTSAAKCHRVLAAKGISTHFCIDWDGTIYQMVDVMHEAWHAGVSKINRQSVGIDFNNPVYPKYNKILIRKNQKERPIISGYKINGWDPGKFLGFHQVQVDAYVALLASLNHHLPDFELNTPAYTGDPRDIRAIKMEKAVEDGGVMHHAHVKKRKWDTAGIHLKECCEAAQQLDVE